MIQGSANATVTRQRAESFDTLPAYPAVDPVVHIVELDDGRMQLRTPGERLTIGREAPIARALLQACDGTRSARTVLDLLEGMGHDPHRARALLQLLTVRRMLMDGAPAGPGDRIVATARHLARCVRDERLDSRPVRHLHAMRILGSGAVAEECRELLSALGIATAGDASAGQKDALLLVCRDCEDHGTFRDYNRTAVAARTPILFACVTEFAVRIGPFVVPGDTACYECFYHRLRANVDFRDEFDACTAQAARANGPVPPRARVHERIAAAIACAQSINYLAGALQHCAFDAVIELNPVTIDLAIGRVLKLPRCEVCGYWADAAPPPAIRDWL